MHSIYQQCSDVNTLCNSVLYSTADKLRAEEAPRRRVGEAANIFHYYANFIVPINGSTRAQFSRFTTFFTMSTEKSLNRLSKGYYVNAVFIWFTNVFVYVGFNKALL